jgi:hypothetical protein
MNADGSETAEQKEGVNFTEGNKGNEEKMNRGGAGNLLQVAV